MKWWYWVIGGVILVGVGLAMRKGQFDSAANARAAKAEKAEQKASEQNG